MGLSPTKIKSRVLDKTSNSSQVEDKGQSTETTLTHLLSLKAFWTRRPSQKLDSMHWKNHSLEQFKAFSVNFSPPCYYGCWATGSSGGGPWIPLMLLGRWSFSEVMNMSEFMSRTRLTVRSLPRSCLPSTCLSSPPSPPSPSQSTAPLWWRRTTGSTSRLLASSPSTK